MNSSEEVKFPPIVFTNNRVGDVINLIKEKNVVALMTETAFRVFHAISFKQPISKESLEDVRVVYIDCDSQHANLLNNLDVWERFIKDAIKDAKELDINSALGKLVRDERSVPHKASVSLF